MIDNSKWTFGVEHEWGDIPRNEPLPEGFKWDDRDNTIVNSNGIANDPKGELYAFGGEINTPPTDTISGQVVILEQLVKRYPMAVVNYRSNTHVHIRVPGLKDNLRALKRITQYNAHWLPIILPIIEPIVKPTTPHAPDCIELNDTKRFQHVWQGALRRYRRRKRSHHTMLSAKRVMRQLTAHTVEQFHQFEVPWTQDGRPMWHAQPRAAVNLRQLLQTDTVEFRHFPGTLDPAELDHAFQWCEHYLLCALCPTWGRPEALDPWYTFKPGHSFVRALTGFPAFRPYNHALEIRYRATCHNGDWTHRQIAHNIKAVEENSFNDAEWEARLKW